MNFGPGFIRTALCLPVALYAIWWAAIIILSFGA
jgi:hypothetical protein